MKSRIVQPSASFQPPETCTEHEECLAAQTPIEDLRKNALAHYEKVTAVAHEWYSVVPRAINAYFDNLAPVAQPPIAEEQATREYLVDGHRTDPRPTLATLFEQALTHSEVVDLVWAYRALVDDDAREAPFFAPEAAARDTIYAECLGLYFQHAERVLGRSPWPAEVDEIESGFCNSIIAAKRDERLARGRAVLAKLQSAASLQPPSPQSEEIAKQIVERSLKEYHICERTLNDLAKDIATAITAAEARGAELQREADAAIKYATVIPVDGNYSVAVGTKEAGVGLKFYGHLHEAKACCESINNNIAAGILATKLSPPSET